MNGTTPVIDAISLAPDGPGGVLTPVGPTDTVRLVTNDFMFGGGDGYTVLAGGTDVLQPGDGLLEITVDYITANSPVDPVVEGRTSVLERGGDTDDRKTGPGSPRPGPRRAVCAIPGPPCPTRSMRRNRPPERTR